MDRARTDGSQDEGRKETWRRNPELEALLAELAERLGPAQEEWLREAGDPPYPIVLVVGAPRSGTTLLTQWLASSGAFCYPTNLLARFAAAPALGARLQLLLTDPRYAFRDELFDLQAPFEYHSELGKTAGALAPNEFWYFWRRFLPSVEIRPLKPEERARVDGLGLRTELAALQRAFERPFAGKGMMLQYDLPFFGELLPEAYFLHVRRDSLHNARSLLESRERFHGDRRRWYSAEPPGVDALRRLDPWRQVAGQVVLTNRAIERGLAELGPSRGHTLDYERFCAAPADEWRRLRDALLDSAADLPTAHPGPDRFPSTNDDRLDPQDRRRLVEALQELNAPEVRA